MSIIIQEMTVQHYDEMIALWKVSGGIGLSEADSKEAIARFLELNIGLNFVAYNENRQLVGTVLCGHDGRRGYLYHLAVNKSSHRQGIGRKLAEHCLSALRQKGIDKCHIFVYGDNKDAISFWKRIGWTQRNELIIMSKLTNTSPA